MKNSLKQISIQIILIFVVIIMILAVCSCRSGPSATDKPAGSDKPAGPDQASGSGISSGGNPGKIGAIVSILPQAGFLERIGKDRIDLMVMVPPGASPHTYEPTPGQLKEVSHAQLYAIVGSGIEFELAWMERIIEMNRNMLITDCSEGINLIGSDPHIWLSVKNTAIMVENIYEGLIEIDPSYRSFYYDNKNDFLKELELLDDRIRDFFKDEKNRRILVLHPSWTYFAADYGLEQISIEVEGKEPTIREMEQVIKQAKDNDIKVIFASPEFSTKSAETIADEIGATVVLISPLEKDYIENMEKAASAFAESMQ